jgi:mono/diheme cytochrome c family protein
MMPRYLVLAHVLAVTAWLTPAAAETSLTEKGRAVLETNCSRCHAIGLEGASPHAEAPPFRDVVKRYPPESLEEALGEGISSGHPDMPEFVFAPEDVGAVIAYLQSLEKK